MKRTYQPKSRRRLRLHGFLGLMKTPGGRNVIRRRRAKNRNKIAIASK